VPHLYQFLTVCVHVNCWVRAILGMQVTLRHTILSVRVGTNDELIIYMLCEGKRMGTKTIKLNLF
jgi:hypothetical protein